LTGARHRRDFDQVLALGASPTPEDRAVNMGKELRAVGSAKQTLIRPRASFVPEMLKSVDHL
jgi:hypothetical protein